MARTSLDHLDMSSMVSLQLGRRIKESTMPQKLIKWTIPIGQCGCNQIETEIPDSWVGDPDMLRESLAVALRLQQTFQDLEKMRKGLPHYIPYPFAHDLDRR